MFSRTVTTAAPALHVSRDAMSNYPTSTQRTHWVYDSHAAVAAARAETRKEALANALKATVVVGQTTASTSEAEIEKDALTLEEEDEILRYHEHKIQSICAAFALPRKVKSTAVMLIKRFILRAGAGAYSLKIMMLTSIYVACKVEESYISADEFCKGVREDPARVLAAEVPFLAGLRFQLVCYSAVRPLDGFLRDIEDGSCAVSSKELIACRQKALDGIDALMLTDVPLVRPPGQIALCALRRAAREEKVPVLVEYCESIGERDTPSENKDSSLKKVLDEIDPYFERGVAPEEAVVKEIDKKLKLWRAKHVGKASATDGDGDSKKAGRDAKRRKSEQTREEMIANEEAALG